MSTKQKFLKEIKEVCDKYYLNFITKDITGINDGTINNLPNYSLTEILIHIPNEDDLTATLSAKELVDFICNEKKMKKKI